MLTFDVRDYGAVGDGETMNTQAIQSAIDACAEAGGGRVVLENGVYLTCPIRLRSYVELHLEANATLLGSPNCEDYHKWDDLKILNQENLPRGSAACLVFAEACHHIALTGRGTIDANGEHFVKLVPEETRNQWKPYERINTSTPPRVVFFACCQKVLVEDVTLTNAPGGWAYFIHDCDDVRMTRLTVDTDLRYPNNDGIHINCSRDVNVSDCNIVSSDDALIVRANSYSLPENKVCERITISNCNLTSHCGGIRLGWIKDGTIRDCSFSNLVMTLCRNGVLMTYPWRGPDRIADEGREKTLIENIHFENIIMDRTYSHPIRLKVDDHENTRADMAGIRKLYFHGIHARALAWPSLEGRPDCRPDEIEMTDCSFELMKRTPEFDPYHTIPNPIRKEIYGQQIFSNISNLRMNNTVFSEE